MRLPNWVKLQRDDRHSSDSNLTDLPEGVKSFSIWYGELSCLISVNTIMQYFSIIQQTQGIGTIAVPFSDSVGLRENFRVTLYYQ